MFLTVHYSLSGHVYLWLPLMTSVVIPWAKPMTIGGQLYDLQITDINIGTIHLLGVVSIGVWYHDWWLGI